jgi:hypothetical protein
VVNIALFKEIQGSQAPLLNAHAPRRAELNSRELVPYSKSLPSRETCYDHQGRLAMELILIIVVLVVLFGGGGYYGRRRGHW